VVLVRCPIAQIMNPQIEDFIILRPFHYALI